MLLISSKASSSIQVCASVHARVSYMRVRTFIQTRSIEHNVTLLCLHAWQALHLSGSKSIICFLGTLSLYSRNTQREENKCLNRVITKRNSCGTAADTSIFLHVFGLHLLLLVSILAKCIVPPTHVYFSFS